MSRVFIFSDPHFGHDNVAKWRGFKDAEEQGRKNAQAESDRKLSGAQTKIKELEEQDDLIVERWNKVVSKRDKVFLLGDIAMKKQFIYKLGLMNGSKVVILGNHDKPQFVPEILKYADKVAGAIQYRGYALTHIPIAESEIEASRWIGNIHGHQHEYVDMGDKYFNVCAENIGFTPILFDELINKNKQSWN